MDIIHQCLSLAPVPYLAVSFNVLRFILSSVEQVQASKQQLCALAQTAAQLLSTLNKEYHAGRLVPTETSTAVADLDRLLDEISMFAQKEALRPFLTLLFTKGQRIAQIDQYHRRIGTAVTSFQESLDIFYCRTDWGQRSQQISSLVNIQAWQAKNNDARAVDQRTLDERLSHFETNHQQLMQTLNVNPRNLMAMMVSLEKRLQTVPDEDREHQFFAHTLRYLTTSSGRQVEREDWMITSYEVEFRHEIGSGGFGQVFEGTWNKTKVALKVLVMGDGVTPSCRSIRNEIKIWANIRHPNILQFLGANILDEKPFIVMPYLQNGNARDFLQEHPDADRLQIIIHGDLKALNVLIDNSAKAVLCDFGLSRVKADVTSRTAKPDGEGIAGSRNWMAPERLLGGSLKKPCDIYAFAMTLYELYANEIPLGELIFSEFVELVVRQDVRPERPDDEDAPQLSDAIWDLAEACWVKDPKERPTAAAVCTILSHLLDTISVPRPTPDVFPSGQLTPPPNLTILGHTDRVWCAGFSIDGKKIVSGSRDRTVRVWDAQTGSTVLGPLQLHTGGVCSVAFSPNGRRISSGSKDRTILVWHAVSGKVIAGPFKGHTDSIWSVTFSLDGKRIASGSRDQTIRIWDAQTGVLLVGPLRGHADGVTSVAFTGDGAYIASGSWDKTVRVWDAHTGRLVREPLKGHNSPVSSVLFSPESNRIVSASRYGNVCAWNADTGALMSGPSLRHTDGALAVTFTPNSTDSAVSPDGRWIVARDNNLKTVHVWDSRTGQLAASLDGHTDIVISITFSPDSRRILSASWDKTIRVHTLD